MVSGDALVHGQKQVIELGSQIRRYRCEGVEFGDKLRGDLQSDPTRSAGDEARALAKSEIHGVPILASGRGLVAAGCPGGVSRYCQAQA